MSQKLWLVVNSASGSFDAGLPDRAAAIAAGHGAQLDRIVMFPDAPLPGRAALEAADVTMLAIHTGDGTINAAVRALGDWPGDVLVLPGGTMNLLARSLHGEGDSDTILTRALTGPARHRPVTAVAGVNCDCDIYGLVGLFAGPTTAWGDVRETLRRLDFAGLIEAVPRAIDQTFGGDDVFLQGTEQHYPAIYVEPVDGKLRLLGVRAGYVSELFEHGWAWMSGDFRNGPHDTLGHQGEAIIEGEADEIGLLVDGERGHCHAPLHLRAVTSPLRFVATA